MRKKERKNEEEETPPGMRERERNGKERSSHSAQQAKENISVRRYCVYILYGHS